MLLSYKGYERQDDLAGNVACHPQAQHLALQERRFQETADFHDQYAMRSGSERTLSQVIRVGEIRQSRYIGLAKTYLEMIATATAINLYRIYDWLMEILLALTRVSPFAALAFHHLWLLPAGDLDRMRQQYQPIDTFHRVPSIEWFASQLQTRRINHQQLSKQARMMFLTSTPVKPINEI